MRWTPGPPRWTSSSRGTVRLPSTPCAPWSPPERRAGLESIEVVDNGCGVPPEQYAALTLKHHTSKIREFDDLAAVETFGFRGEALSSLCALSEVSVTTCTEGQAVGAHLAYDRDGRIAEQTPKARGRGTTVTLVNLFAAWPVRLREMQKNVKREFAKMVQLLQGYCLVRPDVRFSCVNTTGGGRSSAVLRTKGKQDVAAVISVLFGHKQLQSLVPYTSAAPSVSGFVSRATGDAGRGSTDRQFISINRRPCDHPKLSKAVNETFRQFAKNRYPVLVLDVTLPRECVDVNITPDKRSIFTLREADLIESVRAALLALWEPSRSTFALGGCAAPSVAAYLEKHPNEPSADPKAASEWSCRERGCAKYRVDLGSESSLKTHYRAKHPRKQAPGPVYEAKAPAQQAEVTAAPSRKRRRERARCVAPCSCCAEEEGGDPTAAQAQGRAAALSAAESGPQLSEEAIRRLNAATRRPQPVRVAFDMGAVAAQGTGEAGGAGAAPPRPFRARIGDKVAEAELARSISKADFARMEILGQFNLGFIIVRLNDDLFIVDQHATDEKYNFERLSATTQWKGQKLFAPKRLELQAVHEEVVMDNIDIFRRNGFDFSFDPSAAPTQRVRLTQVPLSKGVVFGSAEVDELVFLLSEAPGVMVRPSRLQAVLASRACRSSVMIGSALKKHKMEELVRHMGTMDQPWNCPHGRPTMRHLFNLQDMPANA